MLSRFKGQVIPIPVSEEEMSHPIKTTTTDDVKMMVAREMVTMQEERNERK